MSTDLLTEAQRQDLRDSGFTDDQIDQAQARAHELLPGLLFDAVRSELHNVFRGAGS